MKHKLSKTFVGRLALGRQGVVKLLEGDDLAAQQQQSLNHFTFGTGGVKGHLPNQGPLLNKAAKGTGLVRRADHIDYAARGAASAACLASVIDRRLKKWH